MRVWILFAALSMQIVGWSQNVAEKNKNPIALPGVVVRLKPIEQCKDTIKYNVPAFLDKNDHYLEDVLKKMPGIEVSDNGIITYKGNSINKLNIEGQDLLGNRYNQATRNLPVEAISQVQVMENDQPVKALKGSVFSDKATLNIKLKKGYRMRPFGEIEGTAGKSETTIWNNHLTIINIAKKNQALVSVKMNNTGESLDENPTKTIDAKYLDSYVPLPDNLVNTKESLMLPISKRRYMKNKSYSADINHLHRVGRYGSLRTNISYYGNSTNQSDSTYCLYGGDYSTSVFDRNRLKVKKYTFVPKLEYELNSPNVFILDELSANMTFMSVKNMLNSSGQNIVPYVTHHPFFVHNNLHLTISAGARVYSVSSLLRYYRNSEEMQVTDTTGLYDFSGKYASENLLMKGELSTTFPLFGKSLHVGYAVEYNSDRIKVSPFDYVSNSRLYNSLSFEHTFKYSRGLIDICLPVELLVSYVPWNGNDTKKLYISPYVRWRHELSPKWLMKMNFIMSQKESSDVLYPQKYRSDYRTFNTPADCIGWMRSTGPSLSINYTDFANMIAFNFLASVSWRFNDRSNSYEIHDDYTYIVPAWRKSTMTTFFTKTAIDKTFTSQHLEAKASVSYNRNEMPIIQNNASAKLTSNVLSSTISLRWNKLTWLQISNSATFNVSWQDKHSGIESYTLKNMYDEFDVNVYPSDKISMGVSAEYSIIQTAKAEYNHIPFVDASVIYKLSNVVEFNLHLNNALNRKHYVHASYTWFNYRYFSMPLRGRELILGIKLKF